jgi:hypothetical protein
MARTEMDGRRAQLESSAAALSGRHDLFDTIGQTQR